MRAFRLTARLLLQQLTVLGDGVAKNVNWGPRSLPFFSPLFPSQFIPSPLSSFIFSPSPLSSKVGPAEIQLGSVEEP